MQKIIITRLAALVVVLFAVLAGCDDSTESGSSSGSTASSAGGGSDGGGAGGSSTSGSTSGSSGTSTSSSGADDAGGSGNPTTIDPKAVEDAFRVNQLVFELTGLIGKKVWAHGFYGDARHNKDSMGFLVDNPQRLKVDEVYPHHSFLRLSGTLPSSDWEGAEVIVFGEVKDYGATTGKFALAPTPLVVVEKSVRINPATPTTSWEPLLGEGGSDATSPTAAFVAPRVQSFDDLPYLPRRGAVPDSHDGVRPPGTQASPCDRSVIISGGADESNNHERYKVGVKAKYAAMKRLGFTDAQIQIFYNDGGTLDVGGINIVDEKSNKQKIKDHLAQLAATMPGSCTLTILVTDHGTGYSEAQGYHGARPALSGPEATEAGGKLYNENTFAMDARKKVYWVGEQFVMDGKVYRVRKRKGDGQIELSQRVTGGWSAWSADADGNGWITEKELGRDINGNGSTDENRGWTVEYLRTRVTDTNLRFWDNTWDTDGDGISDVRLHFDGTRYVAERWNGTAWQEMGRDTNGDYKIDAVDGGIDWNLDGNKTGKIGFHEGINLWGNEVLWDDELATSLKALHDKGVHTMVELNSCFGGGIVPNLAGIVENIQAGSSEDTKHYSREIATGDLDGVDETQFLNHLTGIDSASWTAAFAAGKELDNLAASASGEVQNAFTSWETPVIATQSKFQAGSNGDYALELNIPAALQGTIYDFEIILGLQMPRWASLLFPDGLPAGYLSETVPGGWRVYRATPIPDGFKLKVRGTAGSQEIRIALTNAAHVSLGYTMAQPGTVTLPDPTMRVAALTGTFEHTNPGVSSTVKGDVTVTGVASGAAMAGAQVTLKLTGPSSNNTTVTVTTAANGKINYAFIITAFGSYTVTVTNIALAGSSYSPASNVISFVYVNVI